ncbi:MAG: hypothetical protein NUW37_03500, partial [Planctomycetes bacterium]|nr:hypothetical protein [Planctomycetota bacterium]
TMTKIIPVAVMDNMMAMITTIRETTGTGTTIMIAATFPDGATNPITTITTEVMGTTTTATTMTIPDGAMVPGGGTGSRE